MRGTCDRERTGLQLCDEHAAEEAALPIEIRLELFTWREIAQERARAAFVAHETLSALYWGAR